MATPKMTAREMAEQLFGPGGGSSGHPMRKSVARARLHYYDHMEPGEAEPERAAKPPARRASPQSSPQATPPPAASRPAASRDVFAEVVPPSVLKMMMGQPAGRSSERSRVLDATRAPSQVVGRPMPPTQPPARQPSMLRRKAPAWLAPAPERPQAPVARSTVLALPSPQRPPAPTIAPDAADDDSEVIVIAHTALEGTTIRGNTRPFAAAIKAMGGAFKWWRQGGFWYRQQSRGKPEPSRPLERWAKALRDAGAKVRVLEVPTVTETQVAEIRAEIYGERAERLEARADRRSAEAAQAHGRANRISSFIPPGQPILVGHHSERRHRSDLNKIHHATKRGYALAGQAETLRRQAERAARLAEEAARKAAGAEDEHERERRFNDAIAGLIQQRLRRDIRAISVRQTGKGSGQESWRMYWIQQGVEGRPALQAYVGHWTVSGGRAGRLPSVDVRQTDPEGAYRALVQLLRGARMAGEGPAPPPSSPPQTRPSPSGAEDDEELFGPSPGGVAARARPRGNVGCSIETVEQTVDEMERDPWAIPQPIAASGCPRECAADALPWSDPDYQAAVEDAAERASLEASSDADMAGYERARRRLLEQHPRFQEWEQAAQRCVAQFRGTHVLGQRRTETAAAATRRRVEDASREQGVDVRGSAAHLDELSPAGLAAHWRGVWSRTGAGSALAEARRVEQEARDRRPQRSR